MLLARRLQRSSTGICPILVQKHKNKGGSQGPAEYLETGQDTAGSCERQEASPNRLAQHTRTTHPLQGPALKSGSLLSKEAFSFAWPEWWAGQCCST